MGKKEIVFSEIFGTNPVEWFLSCQKNRKIFAEDGSIHLGSGASPGHGLFEKRKGTTFHFSEYFQENSRLKSWAKSLKTLR